MGNSLYLPSSYSFDHSIEILEESKQVCTKLQKEKRELDARLQHLQQMHDDLQKDYEYLERDKENRLQPDHRELLQEQRRRSITDPTMLQSNFIDTMSVSSGPSEMSFAIAVEESSS